jgi:two-component system OmpR family sensor kinase
MSPERRPASRSPGLMRLSVKFGLVLFLTVACALAIVGLAVLPQLESRLVDAKKRELARVVPTVAATVDRADRFDLQDVVAFFQTNSSARVVVFDRLTESTLRPIADSSGLRSDDVIGDRVALAAARTQLPASDRVRRDNRDFAEAAVVTPGGQVVLLSGSLSETLANVRLVRKYLVVAGSIALAVSWLVGYLAALMITRRIGRLEAAAERIAAGDFTEPVVDGHRDEIGQLADAMETMRRRLARLDRARREFIANASHELRTPLFSLGGFLELLDDEDLDEATRQEFLGEARSQTQRLARLATDLLDLSRLDAGQFAMEASDLELGVIAQTVVDEFRAVAEGADHDLRLSVEGSVYAVGDEQRVVQIARILIENAIRHTPPGTSVGVEVRRWEARALLVVRDDGPGIPEEEQAQLFARFYRGDGVKASGSGLGLAIAQELSGRMAGTVKVESRPGATAFTLSLPLAGPVAEDDRVPATDAVSM